VLATSDEDGGPTEVGGAMLAEGAVPALDEEVHDDNATAATTTSAGTADRPRILSTRNIIS